MVDKRLILLTFIFTCTNDSPFFFTFYYGPSQGGGGERSTGLFPEQRLVIEPNESRDRYFDQKCRKAHKLQDTVH